MASPLSIFRKYQTALLVVFGVMLMVSFVVAPSVLEWQRSRGGGGTENAVVVSWSGGELRESDFMSLRRNRAMVAGFLDGIVRQATAQNGYPRVPRLAASSSEEDIVRTLVLAQEARKAGLSVSKDAILDYLEQLGAELIPRNQIGVIFNDTLGTGHNKDRISRMTEQQLFEVLRTELLAQNYMLMIHPNLFLNRGETLSPYAAWQYHLQLNRRVKAEIVPLNVADYADRVGEPTKEEIRALFDEGKDRYPDPDSPEPGFKRRRKIAFQFVVADFDQLVERDMPAAREAVTDEEIQAHYQSNKERYQELDLPTEKAPPAEGAAAEKPASDGQEKVTPVSDEKEPVETPKTADEKPPAETSKPPSEKPSNPTSGVRATSDRVFVSLVQAENNEPAGDSPEPPEKSEPSTEGTTEESAPVDKVDTAESAEKTTPKEAKAASDEKKYKPLDEELRGEIREELARSKALGTAQKEMDRLLAEIRKVVEDYGKGLRIARANETGSDSDDLESFEEEHAFDMTELANQVRSEFKGLVAEPLITVDQTPRVDVLSVQDLEIGKAFEQVEFAWPPQRQHFYQVAFEDDVPLYRPARIRSEARNKYFVYWKIAEQDASVPEYDEAREEVTNAWKQRAALSEAKKTAEELLAKLQGNAVLQEVAVEVLGEKAEVTQTNEFSWMSTGFSAAGMGQPGLSHIEGVEGVNDRFMKSVFALDVGEAGVAVNQPETIVYVVRILSDAPGDEELKKRFLESGSSFEVKHIASADGQGFVRRWYEDLQKEMDVEWQRPPTM
ncbi:MAG: hypothetical protein ACC628_06295 [Pirellulaceae bacterium]